jgi:hypothetical protein
MTMLHSRHSIRNAKEHGIAIERVNNAGIDGRKIAAYLFADSKTILVRKFDASHRLLQANQRRHQRQVWLQLLHQR